MVDRHRRSLARFVLLALALSQVTGLSAPARAATVLQNPVLFVTQVPIPGDVSKVKFQPNPVTATFANHTADMATSGRGGDLYLLIPDPNPNNPPLRYNLTRAAGFGVATGFQGATSIAVRDPCVSFDATRALFSMVVGAPPAPNPSFSARWQIYEVTNLAAFIADPAGVVPNIVHVPNQPGAYDNVSPCYGSDASNGDYRILFVSDLPRGGAAHLFPQLDEYVLQPSSSGLWSMDRNVPGGDLLLLDQSPSGDFAPFVDSAGRVIFGRWDHLQRDRMADDDFNAPQNPPHGAFTYDLELPNAYRNPDTSEYFPAPQGSRPDQLQPHERPFEFNLFLPWMVNQDGSGMETLDHLGRHELMPVVGPSFDNDPNLVLVNYAAAGSAHQHPLDHQPDAGARAAGGERRQVHRHRRAGDLHPGGRPGGDPARPAGRRPRRHRPRLGHLAADQEPNPDHRRQPQRAAPACHSGLYRNPVGLANGTILVSHAGERLVGGNTFPESRITANEGTAAAPLSRYHFRIVDLVDDPACPGYKKYGSPLTGPTGITKVLSYLDPVNAVGHGSPGNPIQLWELQPVEVVARPLPPVPGQPLPALEEGVFAAAGVDPAVFRQYLVDHDLALISSRNVTTRDHNDKQQPWQLVVQQQGGVQTPAQVDGAVYPVKYLQLFQGDLVRGYGGTANPLPGRRVLPRPLHDQGPHPPPSDGSAPAGSVEIAADGSFAALVPAHRALSWQLVSDAGAVQVRERYWVGFGRGEMRVCTSCHGINTTDQEGNPPPDAAPPQALQNLLAHWKKVLFSDEFEHTVSAWSAAIP